jgi:hypothetical protein
MALGHHRCFAGRQAVRWAEDALEQSRVKVRAAEQLGEGIVSAGWA